MRAFIAIDLPDSIKNSLAEIQNQLKGSGADVKWVTPQNIHLTLKFLGEVNEKKIAKIAFILEDTAENNGWFQAGIGSLGAFPKINAPRIIWAGITRGDDQIKSIAKGLEEKILKAGIPKESRPFSSHITIGRVRSYLNREKLAEGLGHLCDNLKNINLEFPVKTVTLFKSALTPKGPIYEAIKEVVLKSA